MKKRISVAYFLFALLFILNICFTLLNNNFVVPFFFFFFA